MKGILIYGHPFSLYKEERSSGTETPICLWGRRKYEQGKKEWMRSREDMSKNQTNRREKHQNFCLWVPYKGGVFWSRLAKEKWWTVMPERRYHLPIICSIFDSYWDIILMFFNMIWLLSWDCQWSAIQAVEGVPMRVTKTNDFFPSDHWKIHKSEWFYTTQTGFVPLPPSRDSPQSTLLEAAKACTYHNATVWCTRLPTGMDLKQLMQFFAFY